MIRLSPALVSLAAVPAQAGFNGSVFLQSIPTLDEIGLGALIALVAGGAGWALRRSRRK